MARTRWLVTVGFVGGVMAWSGCSRTAPPPAAPVATAAPVTNAGKPTPARPAEALEVTPAKVVLEPGDAGFQLLLKTRPKSGTVAWSIEPKSVAEVDDQGYVTPISAGDAVVTAAGGDSRGTMTVRVASAADRGWDFAQDVVPVLTRAGCNAGNCHGRADGQNGFHLSLFGYDPEGDHVAITRGADGRRISRIQPSDSLIVTKATGRVPHAGGPRIAAGSRDAELLTAWIAAGAPASRGTTHGGLKSIRVEPGAVVLDDPGTQQLRVVATYVDGHERDVTRLTNFKSNDDATLAVGPTGRAELLRRGEADLVVRYQSQVISTRLATIINPDLKFDFAGLKRANFIDEELYKRLAALNVPPSPRAGDAAFLRRVSLDLTGLQPQPDLIREFMADADPEKRAKLVDRLLASPEFTLFWKIKFGDLLQISTARFANGASYYHSWLADQLQANAPWDQTVRTLLTALGNPMAVGGGPVNYALDGPDAKTSAEQTAQRFLGLRLRCAQCHDHPFDTWTQDDYYGLAAFFARVERTAMAPGMSGRTVVKLNPKGQVEHLRTKQVVAPRLLDGKAPSIGEEDDPRKSLADWMTAPENPFFARAMANWVWAQLFGKGIADPPDDLSKANPPVHPELLDALARHFVEHKFDVKELIRTIAVSEAYGLASSTVPGNERDTRFFSHHLPRPLTAHQMADALAQATGVPNRFPQKPPQTRAIEVYDPGTASAILDTFGRCSRTVGCSTVATTPLSLRQSLLLIGGDVIESKVSSLNGYLTSLLALEPSDEEIVENLYMRVVCRPPSAEETSRWSAELNQASSRRDAAEDLFWALLNSREFAFNH